MKNFKYLSLFSILVLGIFLITNYNQVDYDQVRLKHSEFLKNSTHGMRTCIFRSGHCTHMYLT